MWQVALATAQWALVLLVGVAGIGARGTLRWLLAGFGLAGLLVACALRWRISHKIRGLDSRADAQKIYHLLGCYEFPWEAFFGINFAFYRTFSSPTISGLYYSTTTIEKTTEKRVNDTDILMHSWFDHGLESEKGKASIQHLNSIHGHFTGKTRNEDFVYVLCCFMADTIRFIDVFGWRSLNKHEQNAVFEFWIQVGQGMHLKNMPSDIAEATKLVNDYVDSERFSRTTRGGIALTTAVTELLTRWYWFVPAPIVRLGVPALLFVIGGPMFVQKLGLNRPSAVMCAVVKIFGALRAVFMSGVLPRYTANRLSDNLLQEKYPAQCPITGATYKAVGPAPVLAALQGK